MHPNPPAIPQSTYWIGDSCSGTEFVRHSASDKYGYAHTAARLALLAREPAPWPLVHACVHGLKGRDWLTNGWGLDPLVLPLLDKLNAINMLETYSSCQGNAYYSPHIWFGAPLAGAEKVSRLLDVNLREREAYYDSPLLGFRCMMPEDPEIGYWDLWFHDSFSLIKFTRDVLGVSVAAQVEGEAWELAQEYLSAMPVTPKLTVAEIEAVL